MDELIAQESEAPAEENQEPLQWGEDSQESSEQVAEEQPQEEAFFNGDPNDLPPELQQSYKDMQSQYTKANQALAEQRKSYEGVDIEALNQKAQYFDRIVTDPQFRAQTFAAADAGNPQAQVQGQAGGETQPSYGVNLTDWKDEDVAVMKEAAMMPIRDHVLPIAQQLDQRLRALEGEVALSDWDTVATEIPAAKAKVTEVSKFLQQNPNFLSDQPRKERFRKALSLFMENPAPAPTNNPRGTQRAAVNGNLTRPSVSTAGSKPKTHGKSLAELLEARISSGGYDLPRG